MMVPGIPPNSTWKHYKGHLYRFLGIALHSETMELMVIYQALEGAQETWVRPLTMWFEEVKPGVQRFTLL
jgi:hypothetical protein